MINQEVCARRGGGWEVAAAAAAGDAEPADVQVNTRADGGEQLPAPASSFPPATGSLPPLCKQVVRAHAGCVASRRTLTLDKSPTSCFAFVFLIPKIPKIVVQFRHEVELETIWNSTNLYPSLSL